MQPLCSARAAPALAAPARAAARTPQAACAAAAPQRARRAVARGSGAIGLPGGSSHARRAAAPPRAVAALEAAPAGEVRRLPRAILLLRHQRSRRAPPCVAGAGRGRRLDRRRAAALRLFRRRCAPPLPPTCRAPRLSSGAESSESGSLLRRWRAGAAARCGPRGAGGRAPAQRARRGLPLHRHERPRAGTRPLTHTLTPSYPNDA